MLGLPLAGLREITYGDLCSRIHILLECSLNEVSLDRGCPTCRCSEGGAQRARVSLARVVSPQAAAVCTAQLALTMPTCVVIIINSPEFVIGQLLASHALSNNDERITDLIYCCHHGATATCRSNDVLLLRRTWFGRWYQGCLTRLCRWGHICVRNEALGFCVWKRICELGDHLCL